jgi:hypothetical protein
MVVAVFGWMTLDEGFVQLQAEQTVVVLPSD